MVGCFILKLDRSPVRAVVRHLGCSCHPDCKQFPSEFQCVAQKVDDHAYHVFYLEDAHAHMRCVSFTGG
jgi:hypothetical protein